MITNFCVRSQSRPIWGVTGVSSGTSDFQSRNSDFTRKYLEFVIFTDFHPHLHGRGTI